MNTNFRAWVTSSAFQVSLSVPQMKALNYLRTYGSTRVELLATVFGIDRRGLIERTDTGEIRLTKAGALLAALVDEAGFNDAVAGLPTRLDQLRKSEHALAKAVDLLAQDMSVESVADRLGISRATLYRHLRRLKANDVPSGT